MKKLFFIFLYFNFKTYILSQGVFLSFGNGISNLSSNYNNRYSIHYNYCLKAGYDKHFNKFGIRTSLGFFNINSKIVDINKKLNIGLIKVSSGLMYDFSPSITLLSQFGIGKTTVESIRIASPQYNYDFDPIDFSYSFELIKKIKIKRISCLSIGLEFSKSLDGIIDNNFWQKDNLKPYFFNANIYFYFWE